MGCISSQPAEGPPSGRPSKDIGKVGAAKTDAADQTGQTSPITTAQQTNLEERKRASESTRKRRLSYVPFKDSRKGNGLEDAGAADEPASAFKEKPAYMLPAKGATIINNIGCISITGKEPGYKKVNQDKVCVLAQYMSPEQSFFTALDGHGPHGHLVANFIAQNLAIILGEQMTDLPLSKALTEAFVKTDQGLKSSNIDCDFSGASATVSILRKNVLTTAWVGDSRGVLGRAIDGRIQAFDISQDHKLSSPRERARIEAAGGRVQHLVGDDDEPMGPLRVWLADQWMPGLAMSRALGDTVAHSVGVICRPDVSEVTLTVDDRFVILASDGVWEFIESQEAADIVAACPDATTACETLTDIASKRWMADEEDVSDDISCIVIFLH